MSYIYILVNPAFPAFINIGYTSNVDVIVQRMNSSNAVPYPYSKYATYEVASDLSDKDLLSLRAIIDPDARTRLSKDGNIRNGEFYKMRPQAAYECLRRMAVISHTDDRLILYGEPTIGSKVGSKKSPFQFSFVNLYPGDEIQYRYNPSLSFKIIDDKQVSYNGHLYTLSPLAQMLSGKSSSVQGPLYFTYNGEVLDDIRKRLHR